MRLKWQYIVTTPWPWSTNTVLPLKKKSPVRAPAGARAQIGVPVGGGDVHAGVRVARLAVEDAAQAEAAGARPATGAVQRQVGSDPRRRSTGPSRSARSRLDALLVFRQRIDLARLDLQFLLVVNSCRRTFEGEFAVVVRSAACSVRVCGPASSPAGCRDRFPACRRSRMTGARCRRRTRRGRFRAVAEVEDRDAARHADPGGKAGVGRRVARAKASAERRQASGRGWRSAAGRAQWVRLRSGPACRPCRCAAYSRLHLAVTPPCAQTARKPARPPAATRGRAARGLRRRRRSRSRAPALRAGSRRAACAPRAPALARRGRRVAHRARQASARRRRGAVAAARAAGAGERARAGRARSRAATRRAPGCARIARRSRSSRSSRRCACSRRRAPG